VTSASQAASVARSGIRPKETSLKENLMDWTAPIVIEICAGLEVTAYLTAEM
jgi:coenzyme PQQ precursor peptide PqqA